MTVVLAAVCAAVLGYWLGARTARLDGERTLRLAYEDRARTVLNTFARFDAKSGPISRAALAELNRRYDLFRKKAPHIDDYFSSWRDGMMKLYPTLTFEEARDLTLRQANGDRYWE